MKEVILCKKEDMSLRLLVDKKNALVEIFNDDVEEYLSIGWLNKVELTELIAKLIDVYNKIK